MKNVNCEKIVKFLTSSINNYRLERTNKITKINIQMVKTDLIEKLQDLSYEDLEKPMYYKKDETQMDGYIKYMEQIKISNPEVYNFYEKLKEKVVFTNLQYFLRNSVSLKIEKNLKNNIKYAGVYSNLDNKITICIDTKGVLYHELLHVASAIREGQDIDGFHYNTREIGNFGVGLNEGYTEILNNRFFNNNNKAYIYHQKLALLIEKFYDNKDDMVEDYFNGNIFNVIRVLLKSMSLEDAIDIIVDMDNLDYKSENYLIDYYKIKRKIKKIYKKSR